jgi:hypothetical protein
MKIQKPKDDIKSTKKESPSIVKQLPNEREMDCECGWKVKMKRLSHYGYPFNWAGECKVCGRIYVRGSEFPTGMQNRIYMKIRQGMILI